MLHLQPIHAVYLNQSHAVSKFRNFDEQLSTPNSKGPSETRALRLDPLGEREFLVECTREENDEKYAGPHACGSNMSLCSEILEAHIVLNCSLIIVLIA